MMKWTCITLGLEGMVKTGLTKGGWDVKNYTGSVKIFKVLGLTPPSPPQKDMSNHKKTFLKKTYLQ